MKYVKLLRNKFSYTGPLSSLSPDFVVALITLILILLPVFAAVYHFAVAAPGSVGMYLFCFVMFVIFLRDYKMLAGFKYKELQLYATVNQCNRVNRWKLYKTVNRWKLYKANKTHKFEKMKDGSINWLELFGRKGEWIHRPSQCKKCELIYSWLDGYIDCKEDEIYLTCNEKKFKDLLI